MAVDVAARVGFTPCHEATQETTCVADMAVLIGVLDDSLQPPSLGHCELASQAARFERTVDAEPDRAAKELLQRLQEQRPGVSS